MLGDKLPSMTRTKATFAALALAAATAQAIDCGAFAHKAEISFSYTGATTLTNFPALVKIADGNGGFSYSACALDGGADVRFASADGAELESKVVTWSTSGTSEFYVKIPELTAGTSIYMLWGNASAPARAPLATPFDPSTYTLSWSFEEEGGVALDGTRQSNYGLSYNSPATASDAVVGKARSFAASSSQYFDLPQYAVSTLKGIYTFTYEGWFKWTSNPSAECALIGLTYDDWNIGSHFLLCTNGKLRMRDNGGINKEASAPSLDTWHYIVMTRDHATGRDTLYVDGLQATTATASYTRTSTKTHYFQVAHCTTSNNKSAYYTGLADEVRVSSICRNGDYAAAVYANVADYASFVTIANADGATIPAYTPPVRQFPVTVAAGAGGSVSLPLSGALRDEGSVVEVTASPADSTTAFYAWEGNCPTLQVFNASLKLPIDQARSVTAIFGKAYHVSVADGDDGTADGSAAHPYASIEAAVAAIDAYPAVVLVGDGEYTLSYANASKPSGTAGSMAGWAIALTSQVALRSVNGAASTTINCNRNSTRGAVALTHIGAVFDGFSITNACGTTGGYNYRGSLVYLASGHIQNCFLGNSSVPATASSAIYLAKGWIQKTIIANISNQGGGNTEYGTVVFGETGTTIDSCVFSNNTAVSGTIRVGNALVRNSLFVNNANTSTSTSKSNRRGGVLSTTGNVVIENCTFMQNESKNYGGALYGDHPVAAVNCAFGGNSVTESANGPDFYGNVFLANSLSSYTTAIDGNVAGTPTVDPTAAATGDYAPTGVSATRNKGLAAFWLYEPGRADIAGNARVNESAPDIGAFEYVSNGQEELAVDVTASAYTGTDTLTVNFSSTVIGAGDGGVAYAWDFGDGSTSTEAAPSHTYASAGYYSVSLTVTDADDETRVASFSGSDLIKVMPSVCYVRAVGESTPVEPYATPETAANDIYSALLLSPAKIDVGEGDIPVGASFSVGTAMEIRGKGPETTRVNMNNKVITLSANRATVADLTLRNSYRNNDWNVGMVNLCAAGTVLTNCVVRDGSNSNAGLVRVTAAGRVIDCTITGGSAVCAGAGGMSIDQGSGAVVERCIVSNNVSSVNVGSGNYNIRGAGIWVLSASGVGNKPVIRNCLVAQNRGASTGASYRSHYGAGVYLEASAIIESCTIVSNTFDRGNYAAGLYVSAAASFVTNTVIWGNFAGDAEDVLRESDVGAASGTTFSHCLAPEFSTEAAAGWTLDACASADPKFNDFNGGDFTFGASSPLYGAGVLLPWMENAIDLAGNPRLFGRCPDIGCYESLVRSSTFIMIR